MRETRDGRRETEDDKPRGAGLSLYKGGAEETERGKKSKMQDPDPAD